MTLSFALIMVASVVLWATILVALAQYYRTARASAVGLRAAMMVLWLRLIPIFPVIIGLQIAAYVLIEPDEISYESYSTALSLHVLLTVAILMAVGSAGRALGRKERLESAKHAA